MLFGPCVDDSQVRKDQPGCLPRGPYALVSIFAEDFGDCLTCAHAVQLRIDSAAGDGVESVLH